MQNRNEIQQKDKKSGYDADVALEISDKKLRMKIGTSVITENN